MKKIDISKQFHKRNFIFYTKHILLAQKTRPNTQHSKITHTHNPDEGGQTMTLTPSTTEQLPEMQVTVPTDTSPCCSTESSCDSAMTTTPTSVTKTPQPVRQQMKAVATPPVVTHAVHSPAETPVRSVQKKETPQVTYRLNKLLGQAAAKVYSATVVSSNVEKVDRGDEVAVKIYDTTKWSNEHYRCVRSEISLLSRLKHDNIVSYYACKYEKNNKKGLLSRGRRPYAYGYRRSTVPKSQVMIIQELCGRGDLFANVARYGAMPAATIESPPVAWSYLSRK